MTNFEYTIVELRRMIDALKESYERGRMNREQVKLYKNYCKELTKRTQVKLEIVYDQPKLFVND